MRPISRPSKSKPRDATDYELGTIDLIGDHPYGINKTIKDSLRHNANSMIDDLVNEYTAEIVQRSQQKLNAQMVGILKDLDQHKNGENQ